MSPVVVAAVLSAIHVLTLALGGGALFARGRGIQLALLVAIVFAAALMARGV